MAPLLYIYNVYNLNNGIFSRKRLRGRLQTFAGMVANVCRNGCKRLQERLQCFASEKGKAGTEIVCPIMYKRKGEERFTIWGTVVLPKNLLNRFYVGPCMIYDKSGK